MLRRRSQGNLEANAHSTYWRRRLAYLHRAGASAFGKRKANRRERHEGAAELADEIDELPVTRTRSGLVVTDEMIEEWAAEAERGYDPDQLRERPRRDQ